MATSKTTTKKSTAAAKPAAKKTAAAKPAAAKPVAAKAPAKKPAAAAAKKPAAKKAGISPEQRYKMVAEAAYYHAERRGFAGDPVQDWIAAEAQIKAQLGEK